MRCPPLVETAAGERQRREKSGHETPCTVRVKKCAMLNYNHLT